MGHWCEVYKMWSCIRWYVYNGNLPVQEGIHFEKDYDDVWELITTIANQVNGMEVFVYEDGNLERKVRL